MGLAELMAAAHTVHAAVLDEMGTRLVEAERDILRHALPTEREHPVVVAGPRVDARLAPYRYLLYRLIESSGEAMMALWRMGSERKMGRR